MAAFSVSCSKFVRYLSQLGLFNMVIMRSSLIRSHCAVYDHHINATMGDLSELISGSSTEANIAQCQRDITHLLIGTVWLWLEPFIACVLVNYLIRSAHMFICNSDFIGTY